MESAGGGGRGAGDGFDLLISKRGEVTDLVARGALVRFFGAEGDVDGAAEELRGRDAFVGAELPFTEAVVREDTTLRDINGPSSFQKEGACGTGACLVLEVLCCDDAT